MVINLDDIVFPEARGVELDILQLPPLSLEGLEVTTCARSCENNVRPERLLM